MKKQETIGNMEDETNKDTDRDNSMWSKERYQYVH